MKLKVFVSVVILCIVLSLLSIKAGTGKIIIDNPYKTGNFKLYKGQMHCHTENSDGKNSPEDVVKAYKDTGYNFVVITDHEYITPDPGVEGITFITGVEETVKRHITAYDLDVECPEKDIQTVLDFHKKNNKLTSIAHPIWRKHYIMYGDELNKYKDFNFIEVFNTGTGEYTENHWDYLLSKGRKIFALATDDCHDVKSRWFNKGWVMVRAVSNNKEDILNSLREGNFYASTGNDLEVSVKDNTIIADSSSPSNFDFIGNNGEILKNEGNVKHSEYNLTGKEGYVRVRSIKNPEGTEAFSQPIFVKFEEK